MLLRSIGLVASLCFVSGCSFIQSTPFIGTDELNKGIADNAEILGDAHADATSGIILENILRARDRWPTSYTTVSGITANPQIDFKASGSFGPLGLGNAPLPFSESAAGLEQNTKSAASYVVNPFTSDNDGKSLFEPIIDELFARYWSANWPKDVLFLVLVQRITVGDKILENDIDEPESFIKAIAPFLGSKDCKNILGINEIVGNDKQTKEICESIVGAHDLKYEYSDFTNSDNCFEVERIHRFNFIDDKNVGTRGLLDQLEKLNALDNNHLKLKHGNNTDDLDPDEISINLCDGVRSKAEYKLRPFAQKVDDEYVKVDKHTRESGFDDGVGLATIELRSIDSAIYYIGEWLRKNGDNSEKASGSDGARRIEKHWHVTPLNECMPDEVDYEIDELKKWDNKGSRLFSVFDQGDFKAFIRDNSKKYGASARHADRVNFAVRRLDEVEQSKAREIIEQIKQSDINVRKEKEWENPACEIDRSGTVMALLTQLFLRSQSSEFLKGPATNVLRTQ